MSTIDMTTTTTKRERKAAVLLTDRMCEKRVAERTKIFDRKCPGFYVSIIPAGVATFNLKFTDPALASSAPCSSASTAPSSPSSRPAPRPSV
jgi:hypothetical protein